MINVLIVSEEEEKGYLIYRRGKDNLCLVDMCLYFILFIIIISLFF